MSRTLAPDDARDLAARDLDDAMRGLGVENAALARHLLVDEKLVRSLRTGDKPLTMGRVYQMPPALREDLLRRAAERFGAVEPAGASTAEAQANVCTGRMGATLAALSEAMRDGVIDACEAESLLRGVAALRDATDVLERRLRAVASSRVEARA